LDKGHIDIEPFVSGNFLNMGSIQFFLRLKDREKYILTEQIEKTIFEIF